MHELLFEEADLGSVLLGAQSSPLHEKLLCVGKEFSLSGSLLSNLLLSGVRNGRSSMRSGYVASKTDLGWEGHGAISALELGSDGDRKSSSLLLRPSCLSETVCSCDSPPSDLSWLGPFAI